MSQLAGGIALHLITVVSHSQFHSMSVKGAQVLAKGQAMHCWMWRLPSGWKVWLTNIDD